MVVTVGANGGEQLDGGELGQEEEEEEKNNIEKKKVINGMGGKVSNPFI